MVMAYAGCPVCCGEASFPVMNVYTSMRTHDNLEEHISSFYAELKRIKGLLQMFENSKFPVFYLLDEILKGTNSLDRHLGAESLVIQLLPLAGMGLISTHDITLSSLEEKYEQVKNYSFNSNIEDDEIIFDYKIYQGVCQGFNASKLMEKMGIVLKNNKG
jgi:DNA mismatch repair ATPase MutS